APRFDGARHGAARRLRRLPRRRLDHQLGQCPARRARRPRMMPARVEAATLIDRLPAVRGRLSALAPIAQVTWFRVGGPAEALFRPADEADLAAFLASKPAGIPVTVLGVA